MSDFFNYNPADDVFNNLVSDDPATLESKDVITGQQPVAMDNTLTDPPVKKPKGSTLDTQLQKINNDLLNSIAAPAPMNIDNFTGSAIKSVDPQYVDKFKAQSGYNPLEFNPNMNDSNTQKAIANETWGSALAKGFDSMLYNAGNTYTSWFSDYGKMFDAITEGDWDAVKPQESDLIRQYYEDQKNADKNYVFVPQEDEDGIFNKKFFSEFLGNVGFTYGTISAIGTELAADALITGLTGGGGIETFGATLARAGSKLGIKQAAKEGVELAVKRNFFMDAARGLSLADKPLEAIKPIVREATEAEVVSSFRVPSATARETFNSYTKMFSNNILNIAKSKSAAEFAENILRGTPLIGTGINFGEKVGMAAKAGASTGELLGMGLQGSRRIAQELNMSISEAMFESVSSYGDTLDMMIKNYQSSHDGQLPDGEEFNKMRDYAVQASSSNYDTNTAILLVTNKLQFGNLFNKFVPANKAMQALEETMADKTIAAVRKKGAFKIFDKSGFFGTFGIIGQVKSEFGKKEAAKLLGKSFLRNSLSFEFAEGAQEIYQEASGAAWKNYYADKYGNTTKGTLSDYFGQGFKDQWSKQGLKTFLTGAMTGMLVKGPSKVLNNVVEKSQEQYYNNKYKNDPASNPLTQAKERLKSDIQMVNAVFQSGGPHAFSNKVVNFNAQTVGSAEMAEAAAKGLQYEFQNSKNNALLAATMAAYRTNTIDGFVTAIKDMGVDYSAEDFKKEFNIDIADTKYNTPQEYAEKVAGDLKKYTKIIEDVTRGVKNRLVDVNDYKEGTPDRGVANHTRKAQEEAIAIVAMNAIKADMTAERIKDMTAEISAIPGLATSSDYAMRVLSNPSFLRNEINTIKSQIKQLNTTLTEGNLTGDVKTQAQEQLKNFEQELELLNKWSELWKQRSEITGVAEHTEFVFAGIEVNKKQRVENAEGKKLWTPVKTWNIKDKKIAKLFKDIINHKNAQAGLNTTLDQSSISDGFGKIVDYIRLDRDSKDYMQAVEVLSDPEKYMSMVKKSEAGLFKYNIESLVSNLEDAVAKTAINIASSVTKDTLEILRIADSIHQDIFSKVKESDAYIALNIIVTDPKLGIESYTEARKYINDIEKLISLEIHKAIKEYLPEQYNNDITEGEMNEIKSSNEIDDFRLLAIAEKKMNNTALLTNEQELYDDPAYKIQIDAKINELQILGYTPKVQVVDNNDGTADVIDTATGTPINNEPLSIDDANDLKDEIENLPSEQTPTAPTTIKIPADEDDNEDLENQTYDQVSDAYTLKEFLALSDTSKIKTLEFIREDDPAYQKLKTQFGKQVITKDQYQTELDKINATIYIPGAEDITLKSLIDKGKALDSNTSANVNSAPNIPVSTTVSQASADKSNTKIISSEIVEKGNRKGQTRTVTQTNSIEDLEGTIVSITEYEAKVGDTSVTLGGLSMTIKEFKEQFPIDEDYEDVLEGLDDNSIITIRKVKRTPTSSRFDSFVSTVTAAYGKMDIGIKKNDTIYNQEITALEITSTKAPVDMEKAEAVVRQMVVPNGKTYTDLTAEEKTLVMEVPIERKREIQAEEEKKWQDAQDAKAKKDEDYLEMGNEEDFGADFEDLFGDQFENKIAIQKENREFTKEFLNTTDEDLINEFLSRAIDAMDKYNKEGNYTIESLKTFSRIPSTKSIVEDIRSSVLASVADEYDADEDAGVDFEDIFGTGEVTEIEDSAKLTVDPTASTVVLNADIQSLLDDYNQAKIDNSKKSSKFVEKGDQSLLDEINDIHDEPGC